MYPPTQTRHRMSKRRRSYAILIYLSPSTQENNLYVNGGTEEYWMNRLADAMVPLLDASGIEYVRNTPEMTAASSITASNQGDHDLHLALHSNAAPEAATVRYGAYWCSITREAPKDSVRPL